MFLFIKRGNLFQGDNRLLETKKEILIDYSLDC